MRVLIAWEMGRNFGHVTQIVPVAEALRRRGAEVGLALRNPAALGPFAGMGDFSVVQAPHISPARRQPGETRPKILLYSDDLLACGYENPGVLARLIADWDELIGSFRPDALVAQSAPTALLATHGLPLRRFRLGRGYDLPPATVPQMPMRHWMENDLQETGRREAAVLATVNAALQARGRDPLQNFADFLRTDGDFLCAYRETDHYRDREQATYYGSLGKTDGGIEAEWRPGAVRRVFAYIQPDKKVFGPAMQALFRLPANFDVIVAAPKVPRELGQQFRRPGFRLFDGPVRLDPLLPDCNLLVNHASSGISNTALCAGIPLLMLPGHIEQLMQARAIGRAGAGLGMSGEFGANEILQTIGRLLNEPRFTQAARSMQARYGSPDAERIADTVAGEIIARLTAPLAADKKMPRTGRGIIASDDACSGPPARP
jgi:UDP:flavonoid glycosyltransferase YjiC (YdhE family)